MSANTSNTSNVSNTSNTTNTTSTNTTSTNTTKTSNTTNGTNTTTTNTSNTSNVSNTSNTTNTSNTSNSSKSIVGPGNIFTKEFIHSSELCEFFWFALVNLMFVFFIMRILKLKKFYGQPKGFGKVEKRESKPPTNQFVIGGNQDKPYGEDVANIEDINIGMGSSKDHEIGQSGAGTPKGQPKSSHQTPAHQTPAQQSYNASPKPEINEDKVPAEKLFEAVEDIVFRFLPFLGIVLLNILNFGCYIFCAFMVFLYFLTIVLFNEMKVYKKNGKADAQKHSENIHLVILLALFLNYLINTQTP